MITINGLRFIKIVFWYVLISVVLNAATSGGWAMMFYIVLGIGMFIWTFIVCALAVARYWKWAYDVFLSEREVILIKLFLLVQFFAMLFNRGDHGDGIDCAYTFLDTLLGKGVGNCDPATSLAESLFAPLFLAPLNNLWLLAFWPIVGLFPLYLLVKAWRRQPIPPSTDH
jgi:hypothetical protein